MNIQAAPRLSFPAWKGNARLLSSALLGRIQGVATTSRASLGSAALHRMERHSHAPQASPQTRERLAAIDPEVCGLVLLAPDRQAYASLREPVRQRLARNLSALTAAARIMQVPVFVSRPEDNGDLFASHLAPGADYRHLPAGPHPSPWLHPDFIAALDKEDRTGLLLAGFWLEYQVLATGLHALAASYDVFVLLDLAPAQSKAAAQPSHHRLMLQGARPVVTAQVIHEWSLAAAPDERASLEALLEGLVEGRTPVASDFAASAS